MGLLKAPENTPVWVNESRCKACDLCVSVCPSGTLGMQLDEHKVLGKIVKVIHPESCIGCMDCELHCPDFAIAVADKKEFKFAKLTEVSKQRAEAIRANGFMVL